MTTNQYISADALNASVVPDASTPVTAPRVDFRLDQTRFDGRIVLGQLGSFLCRHSENGDFP